MAEKNHKVANSKVTKKIFISLDPVFGVKIFLIKKKERVSIWQLREEGDTIVSNQLDGKQPAKMCRAFPE